MLPGFFQRTCDVREKNVLISLSVISEGNPIGLQFVDVEFVPRAHSAMHA